MMMNIVTTWLLSDAPFARTITNPFIAELWKDDEYYLKVTRKPVQGITLPPEYSDECMLFSWETTFLCPVKNEEYKLIVNLEHRVYERIDDVESKLRQD